MRIFLQLMQLMRVYLVVRYLSNESIVHENSKSQTFKLLLTFDQQVRIQLFKRVNQEFNKMTFNPLLLRDYQGFEIKTSFLGGLGAKIVILVLLPAGPLWWGQSFTMQHDPKFMVCSAANTVVSHTDIAKIINV